jgi:hypothetical protein
MDDGTTDDLKGRADRAGGAVKDAMRGDDD